MAHYRTLSKLIQSHFINISFQQLLLPCEDNLLRSVTLDRQSWRISHREFLPADIEHGILQIIESEI